MALEDHEAWTERIMAMPAGRGLRIVDTEEGPLPLLPGTMFLTDAEERTAGPEVSEGDKEVAAWAEAELGLVAPFLNSEIGPGFPEVQDEQPAFEVIEGGEPEGEEPDTAAPESVQAAGGPSPQAAIPPALRRAPWALPVARQ